MRINADAVLIVSSSCKCDCVIANTSYEVAARSIPLLMAKHASDGMVLARFTRGMPEMSQTGYEAIFSTMAREDGQLSVQLLVPQQIQLNFWYAPELA